MKKFMLRGKQRNRLVGKTLQYGEIYTFVTPFDWQYFKLVRGSRYVRIYECKGDTKPIQVMQRKRFIELLQEVKTPPSIVTKNEWREDIT